jgi:hypothetical protein
MHDGPNGSGLSRKAIMSEIDKSLKEEIKLMEEPYIPHKIVGHF